MNTLNSLSSISDHESLKELRSNELSQGITKRLLEKYKPKQDLFSINTIGNEKDTERVA
tara:strand:- start:158 stop:334 length:177 start_codon:yes stop_codon:yes gene_type:complete